MIIKGYILSVLYGALCLFIAFAAGKLGLDKKYTRKTVHILIGFEWFILYRYFGTSFHFLIVCLLFTALLLVTYKKNLFAAISSDADNALGTVYYGISMSLMALVTLFEPAFVLPFGIAVICTSLSDGFAGVVGSIVKKCNPKIYRNKTLFGSLTCFLITFGSVALFSHSFSLGIKFTYSLLIAAVVTGLELISPYGLDNIAVPLGVFALSYAVINYNVAEYTVPILLTPYVIAFALAKDILSPRGVFAAAILDVAVSAAFGNFGFVILLSFLLLSAVMDKVKRRIKKSPDEITEKGDRRDEVQVLANGIVPLVCALLYITTENSAWIVVYIAALAECFADSAASGVGVLSKSAFDPFRMRRVPVGLSGGMSLIGTLASLAGAAILPLIAVPFGLIDIYHYSIVVACAFFGALFDSMLGSLIQVKFKCSACGIMTEKRIHCEKPTERVRGISFVTNDAVNVVSCAACAVLAYVLIILI